MSRMLNQHEHRSIPALKIMPAVGAEPAGESRRLRSANGSPTAIFTSMYYLENS